MKHTVIAFFLLILIIALVIFNSYSVTRITNELCDSLFALPDSEDGFEKEGASLVREFTSLWSQSRPTLSLTVNEDELDRIDEAAAEMLGGAESGEFTTYSAARQRLMLFVPSLSKGEQITAENLF